MIARQALTVFRLTCSGVYTDHVAYLLKTKWHKAKRFLEYQRFLGEALMSNTIAGFVCASMLWIVCTLAAIYEVPKRTSSHAWVVTGSEKNRAHPVLVRANMPFQVSGTTTTVR